MWACSKKRKSAADRVGDAARQELALEQDAVVMVAIEHGHLPSASPFSRASRICWQMNAASS